MTPSLFDLPIRPPEAARLAVLVLEQAAEKPMNDQLRSRIAGRCALLALENLKPWFGSLERDPVHPSAILLMADGLKGAPFLLRMAPNSTPSSGLFPKALLIGRMPGPGGMEIVVNAVPFAHRDGVSIQTFTARVNPAFQPKPRGARSAILVESPHPETVLPAAFECFRAILKERGVNLAGAVDAQTGAWAAIRTGWREGYVTDARNAVPAGQVIEKQRAVCILEIHSAPDAVERIEKCSRYLF